MTADQHDQPSTRERLVGALLGTAVGDAVGAPFEGHRSPDPTALADVMDGTRGLRWTDDTHMALGLARSLIATEGRLDLDHLGNTFAQAHAAEPWRGYGPGPGRVFAAVRGGTSSYVEATGQLFGGEGSLGNGGAMRAAPAAMVAFPDVAATMELARQQASVTHAHPQGRDGAAVVAGTTCALADDRTPREAVEAVLSRLHDTKLRGRLTAILGAGTDDGALADVRPGPTGVTAIESVPAAVACVLACNDFRAVVRHAVLLGGDTDTVAAMAGAMAGARFGLGAIPNDWLDRLEARDHLLATAETLLDHAHAT